MGLKETGYAGRNCTQTTDAQTGLLLQNADSMTQLVTSVGVDPAASANTLNVGVSFYVPFGIEILINAEETGGAATTVLTAAALAAGDYEDVFTTYSSTATALTTGAPFRFRVIDCYAVALDENTADAADTIQLMKVDDDLTTETAITDAMSVNVADDTLVRMTTLDNDANVIDVTENLRVDLVLGNSGTTDHRAYKVYVTCMRCQADA